MSERQQLAIETACGEATLKTLSEGSATQGPALARMAENGAEFKVWPDEVLDELRTQWATVVEEESASDPLFKEVMDSLTAFRAEYKPWNDMGYIQ